MNFQCHRSPLFASFLRRAAAFVERGMASCGSEWLAAALCHGSSAHRRKRKQKPWKNVFVRQKLNHQKFIIVTKPIISARICIGWAMRNAPAQAKIKSSKIHHCENTHHFRKDLHHWVDAKRSSEGEN